MIENMCSYKVAVFPKSLEFADIDDNSAIFFVKRLCEYICEMS